MAFLKFVRGVLVIVGSVIVGQLLGALFWGGLVVYIDGVEHTLTLIP